MKVKKRSYVVCDICGEQLKGDYDYNIKIRQRYDGKWDKLDVCCACGERMRNEVYWARRREIGEENNA